MPDAMRRRTFLRLALAGVGGAAVGVPLSACGADAAPEARPDPTRAPRRGGPDPARVLLAPGRELLERRQAGSRGRQHRGAGPDHRRGRGLRRAPHRAVEPYPADYDATVERNLREQETDARPAIADPLRSIGGYDTILLASPIWNVRAPMIMSTFTESYDFARKTVHPVTTHAMSGLGTTPDDYAREYRGARIAAGLGEQARSAGADVDAWLRRTGLLDAGAPAGGQRRIRASRRTAARLPASSTARNSRR